VGVFVGSKVGVVEAAGSRDGVEVALWALVWEGESGVGELTAVSSSPDRAQASKKEERAAARPIVVASRKNSCRLSLGSFSERLILVSFNLLDVDQIGIYQYIYHFRDYNQ
jgi:hypothetical protein